MSSLGKGKTLAALHAGGVSATYKQGLEDLRVQLADRGAKGIIGLGRKFRILDDDGNGTLSYDEFKKGLDEMNIKLSDAETIDLFKYFDVNTNGTIAWSEFLNGVRGDMNERRKKIVLEAFKVMDADNSGCIEPNDLVGRYDATHHPEVIAGKRTADSVLREFLETFEVGGVIDGKVTKQEFMNYYKIIIIYNNFNVYIL